MDDLLLVGKMEGLADLLQDAQYLVYGQEAARCVGQALAERACLHVGAGQVEHILIYADIQSGQNMTVFQLSQRMDFLKHQLLFTGRLELDSLNDLERDILLGIVSVRAPIGPSPIKSSRS